MDYKDLGNKILDFQSGSALGNILPIVGQWVFYLAVAINFLGFVMAGFFYIVGDSNLSAKDNLKKGNTVLGISVVALLLLLFIRIGFTALASIFGYDITQPLESITK